MSGHDSIAYYNGSWMPFSEVRIDPNDRGFLTGDAVFDAARTFNGAGFLLQAHIDRLYDSLRLARIDPGMGSEEMLAITDGVISRNKDHLAEVGDFQVWQWVTRGPGRWAHSAGPPSVCVKVAPIDFSRYAHLYETGAHAVITRTQSLTVGSVDPKLKTYSRMHFNLAELEAGRVDPEGWPVLVDDRGNLAEGSGYNIFVVRNGGLITPDPRGVLGGLSRRYAIDLARNLDIEVVETDIQAFHLATADEAFFTGTSPCILPVTRADGASIGDGLPGPVTRTLLDAWGADVGLDIADQARKHA